MNVKIKKDYIKPTVLFVPLKIEERLLICGKYPGNHNVCLGQGGDEKTPNKS